MNHRFTLEARRAVRPRVPLTVFLAAIALCATGDRLLKLPSEMHAAATPKQNANVRATPTPFVRSMSVAPRDETLFDTEPETLASFYDRMAASDPSDAAEFSEAFLAHCSATGQPATAVRFALASKSPLRVAWLAAAFKSWGETNPTSAWQFLVNAGPALGAARSDAVLSLLSAWAARDPGELARKSAHFDVPADRSIAYTDLFSVWVDTDRAAALAWLNGIGGTSEADGAIAALANTPDLLRHSPENATLVALAVEDPILRANTLAHISESWANHDPQGLRDFLADAKLKPADQTALSVALESVE